MFERRKPEVIQPMLLNTRQAAKLLSICERTLYVLTKTGQIPAVRIGRAVRYSVAELEAWIERASEQKCENPAEKKLDESTSSDVC